MKEKLPSREELLKLLEFYKKKQEAQNPPSLHQDADYLLFNFIQTPLIHWNTRLEILRFNPAFEELTGFKRAEHVGQKITELLPEESLQQSIKNIQDTLLGIPLQGSKISIRCKGEDIKNFLWDSMILYDNSGKEIIEVIAQIKDANPVLERNESITPGTSIDENIHLYRSVFQTMQEGTYLHDLLYNEDGIAVNYRITAANPASEKILGISPAFAVGKLATELFGVEEAPFLDLYTEVTEKGIPAVFEKYFAPLGKFFHISVFSPGKGTFATIFSDITLRKNAESELLKAREQSERSKNELKKKNEIFSVLIDNLKQGVFLVEAPSGKPIIANQAALKILGRGILPDVTAENLSEVYKAFKAGSHIPYPVEEMPIVRGMYGESSYIDDMVVERPDGTQTYIEIFGSPVKNEKGEIWASLVSFSDITERKRTESEILQAKLNAEESEEKHRFLFENMVQGVVYHKPTGEIEYGNDAAAKILGLTGDQLLGKTSLDPRWRSIHEDGSDFPGNSHPGMVTIRTGKPVNNVVMGVYNWEKNDYNWININSFPRYKNDQLFQVIVTFEDITRITKLNQQLQKALKEIEKSENQLKFKNSEYEALNEELIQTNAELLKAKEGIEKSELKFRQAFLINPDSTTINHLETGVYVAVNYGFIKMLEYSEEEAIGRSSLELGVWYNPADRDLYVEKLKLNKKVENFESRLRTKSGRILDVLISAAILEIEEIPHLINITKDITDRKRIEKEILLAKEKAEENDRLKTAFLQNMSHEIRTPMNAIIGFSELLAESFDNKEKLKLYSKIIDQRSRDLLVIIDDILEIARIESGQLPLHMEMVNIKLLLEELQVFFTEHRSKIGKEHIQFSLQSFCGGKDAFLYTDKTKLKQIFINLIGNAFKFTDQGSILGGCRVSKENKFHFFVADTGTGIPYEKQERIFERFFQVSPVPNRLFGGTGLGLPIVKGLIDLLGGEIWLHSEVGKGSEFIFHLPGNTLESIRNTPSDIPEHLPDIPQTKNILLVEDDPSSALLIKDLLSKLGICSQLAETGAKTMQLLKQTKFDLILLDIGLPDISGYDLFEQIKSQSPGTKVIAQTAYAGAEDRNRTQEAGFTDFISKPINSRELFEIIKKHIGE